MTFTEYTMASARTRVHICRNELAHILGLVGEAGEVADLAKKLFYERKLSQSEFDSKIIGELGDVLWYLVGLCDCFGLTIEEVAEYNIEKLKVRHPDGV